MLFTIAIGIITDSLGITGNFDIQGFLKAHWKFAAGVACGLVIGGIMKNWFIGIFAAVMVIFTLYTVVGA